MRCIALAFIFFFNDTATTEIYTFPYTTLFRSHDLAVLNLVHLADDVRRAAGQLMLAFALDQGDRKSTRLNSSHGYISYAVFCLKKKKEDRYSKTTLYWCD